MIKKVAEGKAEKIVLQIAYTNEGARAHTHTHTHTYSVCVGIATRCGLDSPGIESQRQKAFSHLTRPALGPTQPPIQWVLGLSRGGGCKTVGVWR